MLDSRSCAQAPLGQKAERTSAERESKSDWTEQGVIVVEALGQQALSHIVRHICSETQGLPTCRVRKIKTRGVQRLSLQVRGDMTTIGAVAHDRMPQPRQVHPNLVGAAREQFAPQ
jgi:hypothetical protein